MREPRKFISAANPVSFDIVNLPICTYLLENGKCSELNIENCEGGRCSFCVTKEFLDCSAIKWSTQLNSLREQRQFEIAKKYYCGKKPWQDRTEGSRIHV